MATLQVRAIDDTLYQALGALAAAENRSISQQVIYILKAYLSTPNQFQQNNIERFLALAENYEDSRTAEEIIEDIKTTRHDRGRLDDLF